MRKLEKMTERFKLNPKDFTFDEMQSLLLALGFEFSNKGRTSGSRVEFFRDGVYISLHKPYPRKELLSYQVKQVNEKISTYNIE